MSDALHIGRENYYFGGHIDDRES